MHSPVLLKCTVSKRPLDNEVQLTGERLLVNLIAKNMLPISLVSSTEFHEFIHAIASQISIPPRYNVVNIVLFLKQSTQQLTYLSNLLFPCVLLLTFGQTDKCVITWMLQGTQSIPILMVIIPHMLQKISSTPYSQ